MGILNGQNGQGEMMKQKILYIVRHAKSSWKDPSLQDIDRPLNKRGKRDAPMIAKVLQKRGVRPELILSSPAKRAKKTAKAMHQALGGELRCEQRLYDASLSTLNDLLAEAFEQADQIMIVGHNPAITQLNNTTSNITIYHLPTTAAVAIALESYRPLKGTQLFYEYPKKHLKTLKK